MAEKREKTVSYRRAEWINPGHGLTLEKCLREAHVQLSNIGDRWVTHGEHLARSAKQKNAAGGLLLHITTETPGESASVVPKVDPTASEISLTVEPPPSDGEWLDGDAFLFVQDDNVCICTTGIRDGAVRSFLWEFFKKAKLRKDSTQFDLMKVADVSKVKLLHSQGVKEVELRGSLYEATLTYERRKAQVAAGLGVFAKHLRAILKKPNDVTPDALRVGLTIKTDERKGGLALGQKRIEQFATDVVKNAEKGDEYVIITQTGQRITQEEIFVRTKVSIDRHGKTVQCEKAWNELVKFYNDLKSVGVVEQ